MFVVSSCILILGFFFFFFFLGGEGMGRSKSRNIKSTWKKCTGYILIQGSYKLDLRICCLFASNLT